MRLGSHCGKPVCVWWGAGKGKQREAHEERRRNTEKADCCRTSRDGMKSPLVVTWLVGRPNSLKLLATSDTLKQWRCVSIRPSL